MRAMMIWMTNQALSRKSAHPDLRASATPPASPPRTSWHCQDSALQGTNSGSPMEPSPTRSSFPQAQTRPHHQPRRLPLCLLGTPGKVQLAHLQHSL
uniref:Alternative protein ASAP1 n=1 Tax=Homo sapiens TaxID=9606 RepID=L8E8W2_HUMAN|nr:alternative protein ASAP1 [Homo sapiens]